MSSTVSKSNPGLFEGPTWSLGFRPFYLLGAIFATLLIPLWILHLSGLIEVNGPFSGSDWHAHEMIFGFAPAVLTGFLFTAVRNWTGVATPFGFRLFALGVIWLLARVLMIAGPAVLASIIDLLFLPLMAVGIAVPIWQSNNRRNIVIVVLVMVLYLANCAFHADAWGLIDFGTDLAFTTGLNIFAVFLTLIAGRVMPMFINNAIAGAGAGSVAKVEKAVMTGMVLVVLIELVGGLVPPLQDNSGFSIFFGLFLLLLALLHLVRIWRWRAHRTLAKPIVWIMPLSYFWLAAGVGMKGLSIVFAEIDPAIAVHMIGVGAVGGMMIGMMTRSALGHTGRAVEATPVETACFWLIQLAVLARVAGFAVPADYYIPALLLTALFWSSAFALFTLRYWPFLTRGRADMMP